MSNSRSVARWAGFVACFSLLSGSGYAQTKPDAPGAGHSISRSVEPAPPPTWQAPGSDIPADPAWRTGTLPNGLRYAVRRNKGPGGVLAIRVRMDVGAFNEEDGQLGWAHLLEHMTFRGTPSLTDGEASKIWQRLGASFGNDTNAFTSRTSTLYQLDLPKTDVTSTDLALGALADMLRNATIAPEALAIERKVVLSELALRLPPLTRKFRDASNTVLLPGLLAARRDVGGTPETLTAATAEALRAFYHRWYRPDRAVVVIVGDADTAMLEAAIKKAFGDWSNPASRPVEPDYGTLGKPAVPAYAVVDPQAPDAVSLYWQRPSMDGPWTIARLQQNFRNEIALAVFRQRLATEAQRGGAIVNASVSSGRDRHGAEQVSIGVVPQSGDWRGALDRAFAILNGALAAPPSQAEIDQQLAIFHEYFAKSAIVGDSMLSTALARDFISNIDTDAVTAKPAFYRDTFDALRSTFTPASVLATLHQLFAPAPGLILSSKTPVAGGNAVIATALTAARGVVGAAYKPIRTVSLDELRLPATPGTVTSTQSIADLGVERVRFSNGVELVLKRTSFEKGVIVVQAQVGHGVLNEEQNQPNLGWSANAITASGFGPFQPDEIDRLLSGRQIGTSVRAPFDATVFTSRTNAEDAGDAMRVMVGAMTQARFTETPLARLKSAYGASYQNLFSSPGSVLGAFGERFFYGGDTRFAGSPDLTAVQQTSFAAVRAYWTARLAQGPIKVVVVGDFDRDAIVKAAQASFGALPARTDRKPTPAEIDTRPTPANATPFILRHRGAADQAIVQRIWPTTGTYTNLTETRALRIAAAIIQNRLTEGFREESGGAYSPSVSSVQSVDLPKFGLFMAGVQLEVGRIDDFDHALDAVIADLAANGPSADALERARGPLLSGRRRALATTEFWLGLLSENLDDSQTLDSFRSAENGYQAITPGQVQAVVAKFLRPGGSFDIRVLPEGKPAG